MGLEQELAIATYREQWTKWRDVGGRRAELYGCSQWSWSRAPGTYVCEHEHMPPTALPTWNEMCQESENSDEPELLSITFKIPVVSETLTSKSRSPASKGTSRDGPGISQKPTPNAD